MKRRRRDPYRILAGLLAVPTLLVVAGVIYLLANPAARDAIANGRPTAPGVVETTSAEVPTSDPTLSAPTLPPSWTPALALSATPTLTPLPSTTPLPPETATPSATPTVPTPTATVFVTPAPAGFGVASRVLIVSVDGLHPDAISAARTPAISSLMAEGAYTMNAQTIFPPTTLPGHASMLSGFDVETHGIDTNEFWPAGGTIRAETIFLVAKREGLRTVMLGGKDKMVALVLPGSLDLMIDMNGESDRTIGARAASIIRTDFGLMFVHLPETGQIGHEEGWLSSPYMDTVSEADRAIQDMLDALDDSGLRATTLVIVTSDHGGHDKTHFDNIPDDMTIPWVMSGPGVRVNERLGTPVNVMDTAATALHALGIAGTPGWDARAIIEAF